MSVHFNSSIPDFFDVDGITLYPFIFIRFPESDTRTPTLLKHEMVHVEQVKRMGFFKFYATYIYYHFKYGYKENPLEKEAYERETQA